MYAPLLRRCTTLLASAFVLLPIACKADKTDIVYLLNGDRITCEIKRLDRGRLQVSTDGMGTVYIEWEDIARVISKELYIVELDDGERVQGTLAEPAEAGVLVLSEEGETRRIEMAKTIWIDPLKLDEQIVKRWDGSLSAGIDATKANSTRSFTGNFDARRRAERWQLNFDGSWYSRSQDEVEDTVRATFTTFYRRLLEDRWYWALLGGLERNDELGIDLRTLGGGGYGRFLIQSGRSLWSATAGVVAAREERAGSEDSETNLEGLLATDFEYFTYDTPKTTIGTALTVFPSITDSGRVRANLDLTLRRELIEDFFWDLSVYDSYDTDPPLEGEKNDYGIVTSLGYTF